MFERTLDIISLFMLAMSNTINLFLFLFFAVPYENVRKMKLFHTDCPDLKKEKKKRKKKKKRRRRKRKKKRERKKRKIHDMYTKLRSSGILSVMSY